MTIPEWTEILFKGVGALALVLGPVLVYRSASTKSRVDGSATAATAVATARDALFQDMQDERASDRAEHERRMTYLEARITRADDSSRNSAMRERIAMDYAALLHNHIVTGKPPPPPPWPDALR